MQFSEKIARVMPEHYQAQTGEYSRTRLIYETRHPPGRLAP
jgi:hypothetical protein